MSSDEYQVQNVYRYARKSYKKNNRKETHESGGLCPQDDDVVSDQSPRSDRVAMDIPGCSCDLDHEGAVASLLHKKCPVITLATQQLQRLLDNTDRILCDNTRCCRSMYDFLCICREILLTQKCVCALVLLIGVAFLLGLLFGAASCGSYLGHFESPIMACLDSFFIPERTESLEVYRGIV